MDRTLRLTVDADCCIRDFLRRRFSYGMVRFLREKGALLLGGREIAVISRAKKGDELTLLFKETGTFPYPPADVGLLPVYSDEDVAVVQKPAGVACMPAFRFKDTLFNGLAFLYPGEVFRVVTRLDRFTSGLVLLAKNALSHSLLHAGMEGVAKEYTAVVENAPAAGTVIDLPIAAGEDGKRCVSPDGKPAETRIISVKRVGEHTFVTLRPITGRTHQIRVHLAAVGCPITGDPLYGSGGSGQLLCCSRLAFSHPITGEKLDFSIDGEAELLSRM